MISSKTPFPSVSLVQKPTPLHLLPRISKELGIEVWIKRDDLTGFAGGGNKGRKIEYLIGKALAAQVEVIVACGSTQSNFLRQMAAACSMFGIQFVAVTMPFPYEFEPLPEAIPTENGNVRLLEILDADWIELPNGTWDELLEATANTAREFIDLGKRTMNLPIGGSGVESAFAFVEAGRELGEGFDHVVVASSSGSTHTGLAYCFWGSQTMVHGIACDPEPDLPIEFAQLASELDQVFAEFGQSPKGMKPTDFVFDSRFVGPGYGVTSDEASHAIRKLAQTEGIYLDPIYSGKAFAGLLEMARSQEIQGKVCFWHTGGFPTLFEVERV